MRKRARRALARVSSLAFRLICGASGAAGVAFPRNALQGKQPCASALARPRFFAEIRSVHRKSVKRLPMTARFICLLMAVSAMGEEHGGHALGTVDFPISCSKEAQAEFHRALALFHHMTYPQARTAFERVAVVDPKCPMAHWGIAMTLFQPLWPTRPGPDALRRGWEEVQKAKELQPSTERERLFIAAAEAFFTDPAS